MVEKLLISADKDESLPEELLSMNCMLSGTALQSIFEKKQEQSQKIHSQEAVIKDKDDSLRTLQ